MQLWHVLPPNRFFSRKADALNAADQQEHPVVRRFIAHGPMNASRCAKMANGDETWADEIKRFEYRREHYVL